MTTCEGRGVGGGDDDGVEAEAEDRELAAGRGGVVHGRVPQEVHTRLVRAVQHRPRQPAGAGAGPRRGRGLARVGGLDGEDDEGAGEHHGGVEEPDGAAEGEEDQGKAGRRMLL